MAGRCVLVKSRLFSNGSSRGRKEGSLNGEGGLIAEIANLDTIDIYRLFFLGRIFEESPGNYNFCALSVQVVQC